MAGVSGSGAELVAGGLVPAGEGRRGARAQGRGGKGTVPRVPGHPPAVEEGGGGDAVLRGFVDDTVNGLGPGWRGTEITL